MKQKKYFLSGCRITTVVILTVITYLSLIPSPPVKGSPSDKINHLIAYGVLSFLCLLSFGKRKKIPAILLFCIIWGILMEFLQIFTGRYFEVFDMLANTLGVFCGYALYLIYGFITKKFIHR